MTVLVTGGMGYIGSHTCVELLKQGMDVVVIDNLVNSSEKAKERIEEIAGKTLSFYKADVRDRKKLDEIFLSHDIDCVIHFAGLKAVGESVEKPLEYYDNNLGSTITLCEAMRAHDVKKIIFSSSATVYSSDNDMPLYETSRTGKCTNPYGWTKYMCEQILRDYIHVVDLARGHVAAISYMDSHPGELIFNLGTGKGCSVLELVHAFEKANKLTVPYKIVGRRAGDIDECYCSPEKSRRELGWTAQYNVEDMCRDSWHWQTLNPNGYRDE